MSLIVTNELCKKYGNKLVIDHVNMHIPEASIYGFVGENGSGKTTIMRLLTGLAEPTSGSFELFGVKNTDRRIYEVRRNISAIVEATSLVPTLTAKQNIRYLELYLGISLTEEERDELLKKVHLENVGNKKVKNYSLGMRQRLGIAMALINQPKVMFLDEPMNGLDPEGIAELRDLLIELNKNDGISQPLRQRGHRLSRRRTIRIKSGVNHRLRGRDRPTSLFKEPNSRKDLPSNELRVGLHRLRTDSSKSRRLQRLDRECIGRDNPPAAEIGEAPDRVQERAGDSATAVPLINN